MKASELSIENSFLQRMTRHINGGSEYSALSHDILVKSDTATFYTGISMHVRTDGSPRYKVTKRHFNVGEQSFDTLDEALEARRSIEPQDLSTKLGEENP